MRVLRAFLVLGSAACAQTPPPAPFTVEPGAGQTGARVILVGDLQRTSHLKVWRERIVTGVAAAKPDLLVLLGDLVFDGSSDTHWARFAVLATPIPGRPLTGPPFAPDPARARGPGIDSDVLPEHHSPDRGLPGLACPLEGIGHGAT